MRRPSIRWGSGLLLVVLLAVAVIGVAVGGGRATDRAYELEQRLRCPVCKSVSIADSPSDTAQAMRQVVRDQIAAGRTDDQIIDHFRARYGGWVLLDPPMSGSTLALWIVSLVVVASGTTWFVLRWTRRPEPREPSTEDREMVAAALEEIRMRDPIEEQP
ncbi:cytochrome c-type biogenesis protein CcmH [Lentzea albidocapillata subsp. violacea]|uniref:Cytochrome c-type biogenesis protein n=1 Tax=Lentzea albidocapillata subsp. violacea TaxID=128104 RepID=A0A1G9Z941_9PSEU|nr:cytochrome c-type biogenesis protein [Lentzea albidocapillata]SDN17854.1 cytochrome c-type biogenesis protein CcmH [Lentzea albidocapillata subsp. violacea]